jgi:hypothetical protein
MAASSSALAEIPANAVQSTADPNSGPDTWRPELASRWDRIAHHDFEPNHPLNFICRLARDKSWTLAFARGAVAEYRRFCFLTLSGSGVMTPSEEVDEVWHQHLTYTRDYWDVWCGSVLGAPLHHDPTEGGPEQDRYFRGRYAATLAAYERFFGPPPELFWPATHIRFASRPRFRSIDGQRWMLLPWPGTIWRKIRSRTDPCR